MTCESRMEVVYEDGSVWILTCASMYDSDDERHPESHSARVWWLRDGGDA